MLSVAHINSSLLIAGLLFLISVVASKVSTRYGIPALVIFIGIGMLAGSEGIGGLYFDNYRFAYAIGVIALVLILFGGGLDSNWKEIKPILGPGLSLSSIGIAVTAATMGAIAHYILNIPILQGLLLGAIVSSTDAAAVFGVLRAQKLKLKGRLTPLLEFESGSNDPMAVFLTVGLAGLAVGEISSGWTLLPRLVEEWVIGACGGYLIGKTAGGLLNRLHLEYDGLYHVLMISVALLSYGAVQAVGGSGFLSVYVAGVVLGGKNFVHREGLIQFQEGLGWLMQIVMFLTLGLLVYPSNLLEGMGNNLVLAFALVFIARPIAVFACLAPFRNFPIRKKLFVSWVGLRGAVPIVLATIPLLQGVEGAAHIFNAVFFIVLVSVALQGTSIGWVARKLGVVASHRDHPKTKKLLSNLVEVRIPDNAPSVGKSVVELNLPEDVLLVLMTRGRETSMPRGSTIMESGDHLLVQSSARHIDEVKSILMGKEQDI